MAVSLKDRLAKVVRIFTTPPVFAFALCTIAYFELENAFASPAHYWLSVFFLTLLPLLSYLLFISVPALRKKGRNTERNLALAFSVVGYIGGFLFSHWGGTTFERAVMDTYLFSGALLALCTLLHFKASGHTCGCSGALIALALFVSPWYLPGYILLTPVVWSSLKLKRHTPLQLLTGALIPVMAMLLFRQLVL